MKKHSVTIEGHRTSLSLEEPFWQALRALAKAQGLSVSALVTHIDRERVDQNLEDGLSSAIRVFVLKQYSKE